MSRERFNKAEERFWNQQAEIMTEAGFEAEYAQQEVALYREKSHDEEWLRAAGFGNETVSPRTDFMCWWIQSTNLICYINLVCLEDEQGK